MTHFFYSNSDQQFGPITSGELKQLAAEGRLLSTDLVWQEGGAKKVRAAQCRGLVFGGPTKVPPSPPRLPPEPAPRQSKSPPPLASYSATTQPSADPVDFAFVHEESPRSPTSTADSVSEPKARASVLSSFVGSAKAAGQLIAKQTERTKLLNVSLPNAFSALGKGNLDSEASGDQAGAGTDGTGPSEPDRLPDGKTEDALIFKCKAAYQGGHPRQTDPAEGVLLIFPDGLYFVAKDQSHDISMDCSQLLDVSNPVPGSFPETMVEKAESLQTLANYGQIAGSLAGFGSMARAVNSTRSKQNAGLGATPKNRLVAVIAEGPAKHKLLFDVRDTTARDMEKKADEFWRKTAKIRAHFFKSKPVLPAPGPSNPRVSASVPAPIGGFGTGLQIIRAGVPSGPHSEAEIRSMIERGELSSTDAIRIEVWLPISALGLLGIVMTRPSAATPNETQGDSFMGPIMTSGTVDSQPEKSIAPIVAAGVGGLVAGAIATSLLQPGAAHASSGSHSFAYDQGSHSDTVAIDTDGDGLVDAVGVDMNHDGRIDGVGIDTDHDGHIDAVGLDSDGDGDIDAVGVDTDHDGHLDTYGIDADGDGDIDVIGHDYDEDGDIDAFETE